jgi:hypothetical protein
MCKEQSGSLILLRKIDFGKSYGRPWIKNYKKGKDKHKHLLFKVHLPTSFDLGT